MSVQYSLPAASNTAVWTRTHPSVTGLAGHVLDRALDPVLSAGWREAARCGVMRTQNVKERTTLILCRTRMTISTTRRQESQAVAEETLLAAFTGMPQSPQWLSLEETERLSDGRTVRKRGTEPGPGSSSTPSWTELTIGSRTFTPWPTDKPKRWKRATTGYGPLTAGEEGRSAEAPPEVWAGQQFEAQKPDILGVYIYLPVVA